MAVRALQARRVSFSAWHAAPEPLPALPLEPPRGHRARRPGVGLPGVDGADRDRGAQGWGVGAGAPLQRLRRVEHEPRGRRRLGASAHADRGPPACPTAVPARTTWAGGRPGARHPAGDPGRLIRGYWKARVTP